MSIPNYLQSQLDSLFVNLYSNDTTERVLQILHQRLSGAMFNGTIKDAFEELKKAWSPSFIAAASKGFIFTGLAGVPIWVTKELCSDIPSKVVGSAIGYIIDKKINKILFKLLIDTPLANEKKLGPQTSRIASIRDIILRRAPRKQISKPVLEEEVAQRVSDLIESINYTKNMGGEFQSLFLHGPSGTGKTMIAEWIAQETRMTFIHLTMGDINRYTEDGGIIKFTELLDQLEKTSTPTILFLDEVEGMFPQRCEGKYKQQQALTDVFLDRIDKGSNSKYMLILATNHKEKTDIAVRGRMNDIICVDLPGLEKRKELVTQYVEKIMHKEKMNQPFLSDKEMHSIAKCTELCSARELEQLMISLHKRQSRSPNQLLTQKEMYDLLRQKMQPVYARLFETTDFDQACQKLLTLYHDPEIIEMRSVMDKVAHQEFERRPQNRLVPHHAEATNPQQPTAESIQNTTTDNSMPEPIAT